MRTTKAKRRCLDDVFTDWRNFKNLLDEKTFWNSNCIMMTIHSYHFLGNWISWNTFQAYTRRFSMMKKVNKWDWNNKFRFNLYPLRHIRFSRSWNWIQERFKGQNIFTGSDYVTQRLSGSELQYSYDSECPLISYTVIIAVSQ